MWWETQREIRELRRLLCPPPPARRAGDVSARWSRAWGARLAETPGAARSTSEHLGLPHSTVLAGELKWSVRARAGIKLSRPRCSVEEDSSRVTSRDAAGGENRPPQGLQAGGQAMPALPKPLQPSQELGCGEGAIRLQSHPAPGVPSAPAPGPAGHGSIPPTQAVSLSRRISKAL